MSESQGQEKDAAPLEEEESLSVWARLWGGLWALVALVAVFSFWQNPYLLTLVSAFRFQLLLGLVVVSLPPLIVFPGRRKLLFVGVPLMFFLTFASYLVPLGGPAKSEDSLAVVVANVYSQNRNLDRLSEWLDKNPSDVVGVIEVSDHHEATLREMGFEHVISEPRKTNFGMALLSREAPLQSEILAKDSPFPVIWAEYDNYQIVLAHPPPPVSVEMREIGDLQVEELLRYFESSKKPIVFMGDFNARIMERAPAENDLVGPFFFSQEGKGINELSKKMWDNRQRLIELCIEGKYVIKNTWFQKGRDTMVTYKSPRVRDFRPPCNINLFDKVFDISLEYFLSPIIGYPES